MDDAAYTIKLLRNEVLKERVERQEVERKLKALVDGFEELKMDHHISSHCRLAKAVVAPPGADPTRVITS